MTVSDTPTKFRRESAARRREDLICATLVLIAEQGIGKATVREIAQRAGVTQGLIRHYFSSKEDLIAAAYEYHMSNMTNQTAQVASGVEKTGKARLAAFVRATLEPPVVDADAVALWAGFLTKVRQDPDMARIHRQTYHEFRDRLEALISDALRGPNHPETARDLRSLAIACNAVIDGLWLEGGALPEAFEPGELARIGLQSVGAIIGINLEEAAPT